MASKNTAACGRAETTSVVDAVIDGEAGERDPSGDADIEVSAAAIRVVATPQPSSGRPNRTVDESTTRRPPQ